jgi:hypothetical protein
MIKVIPFKAEHVECMDVRDYENKTVCSMPQFSAAVKQWEDSKNAATIINDGRILAVMGFMVLWQGVCEVYILPSKYISKYPHAFARCLKKVLSSGAFNTFHRIQLRALKDDLHSRFNKFLGFEKEGTFKKYDSEGNDFVMWAITKEGV